MLAVQLRSLTDKMRPMSTAALATSADEITANVGALVIERWHGSNAQLADHMGLSADAFSRRMTGVSKWAAHELAALAVLLRCPVSEMYARSPGESVVNELA